MLNSVVDYLEVLVLLPEVGGGLLQPGVSYHSLYNHWGEFGNLSVYSVKFDSLESMLYSFIDDYSLGKPITRPQFSKMAENFVKLYAVRIKRTKPRYTGL